MSATADAYIGDPEVKKVIEKLAEFTARNGRSFEDITRERNSEDGPFKYVCSFLPILPFLVGSKAAFSQSLHFECTSCS